ncbi:MAG: sigma-54-dependent transcriptional regulator [Candidatus Binatia bacterium]
MEATVDRILVVDDEPNMLALFQRILGKEGYMVQCAPSGDEALERLESEWFDLLISDLKMSGLSGLELLKRVKAVNPSMPFILLTAYGTVDSAVAAMKEGAYDYLTKPINNDELIVVVKKALELHRLSREVERLRSQLEIGLHFEEIVGHSRPMRAIFRLVKQVAKSNATVLIQGESGTGKELIARAIHRHSLRHDKPFVAIDCASLPETLLESELFGHMRGAFTGAFSHKKGLFEEAHGGTLLLDEIGETTPAFQLKLLRVLQEGESRPVGGTKNIKVDVRVIAATNKNLRKEVERGAFREDLFYRLAVVPIVIPPLRDRREDIPYLVDRFIRKYCKQNSVEPKWISANSLRSLADHSWAGNVRELENVIERAVLMSPGTEINPEVLFPDRTEETNSRSLHQVTKGVMQVVEKEKIAEALQMTGGNRSRAAKLLGISRAWLYKKLRSYDLSH